MLKKAILTIIKIYQVVLSPQTGWLRFLYNSSLTSISGCSNQGCRFWPTCSEYTKQTIKKYPLFLALKKSLKRIGRCHSFNSGEVDLP